MWRRLTAAAALYGLLGNPALAATRSVTLASGQTLGALAAANDLSLKALLEANPGVRDPSRVRAGTRLKVPVPDRQYRVRAGDTLLGIAVQLDVNYSALLRANQLDPGTPLRLGRVLTVPGQGSSAAPTRATATTRTTSTRSGPVWRWPVSGYTYVSSGFGGRNLDGSPENHYGIDIVAPAGTAVRAARAGRVTESRPDYDRGWGWTVIVDHGDGWKTRYAHLSANLIKRGERVVRGQVIGRVGSTGRSTGPHLHFGTYLSGVPRDPAHLY